ncbi:MAG: D-alanine--D-alanine ligase [Oligoflexales bacterium]|nr:D-alanine--D-alanine ligase [Oligoflexales bacterium]
MKRRIKVIVLYGGRSTEHEVSLRSAAFIINNLDERLYDIVPVGIDKDGSFWPQDLEKIRSAATESVPIFKDMTNADRQDWLSAHLFPMIKNEGALPLDNIVVFPIIHGTTGEDGCLQGLLDLSNIAYVGADTLASAIGMDKLVAKKLVAEAGIKVVPYIHFREYEWLENQAQYLDEIQKNLSYPVFVKPASLGSSVGISRARNETGLIEAVKLAFEVDEKVLVEKAMTIREIEFAALGEYDPEISEAGEIIPEDAFYSYEEKYSPDSKSQVIVPAVLPKGKLEEGQELSKRIFKILQLYGMARIDMFLTKDTFEYYFNEANTIPGFTSISQYPQLWKHAGYTGKALVSRLIDLAVSRYEKRMKLKRVTDNS